MPLISTEELHDAIKEVKIIDASWLGLPMFNGRDARKEFEQQRIPGALFYDLDLLSNKATSLPHMLPTPEEFSSIAGGFGFNHEQHIVCYDSVGIFSSPRFWWTMKTFGFDNVSVLNGGLKKWIAEGRPIDNHPAIREHIMPYNPSDKSKYPRVPISYNSSCIATYPEVKDTVQKLTKNIPSAPRIIDARSSARFRGEAPEPRGLPSGHMQGAKNLPYGELLDHMTGTFLPIDRLRGSLIAAGFNPTVPTTFTCGSGVTACIPLLAAEVVRQHDRLHPIESDPLNLIGSNSPVASGKITMGSQPEATQNTSFADSECFKLYDGAWSEWCLKMVEEATDQMINDNPAYAAALGVSGDKDSAYNGPVKLDVASRNLGLSLSRSKSGVVGPIRLTEASPSLSASKGGVIFDSSDSDSDGSLEPLAVRLNRSKDGSPIRK